jgi:hypothetical protein
MEKRLDDIYKGIQQSLLSGKAEVGDNNNDNSKKHEERYYMFLNPRPIKEMERNSIDTARRYSSPSRRVKKQLTARIP